MPVLMKRKSSFPAAVYLVINESLFKSAKFDILKVLTVNPVIGWICGRGNDQGLGERACVKRHGLHRHMVRD